MISVKTGKRNIVRKVENTGYQHFLLPTPQLAKDCYI